MPTVLEAINAKTKAPAETDGISLLPTLLGQDQAARPFLYREFTGYGGQQTIRTGDWKAVRQNLARGKIKTELYNIASDISEKHDVAADHPDIVAKLESMMDEQHVPSDIFPLKALDATR
jgi:arylsulfatase